MDNSGSGPLRVPGFNRVSLYLDLDPAERFAHGSASPWRQSPRITARELAMLRLMNKITDEPLWNDNVFDETFVAAIQSKKVNHVLVLDSGSCVSKSDTLITPDLRDWEPNTGNQVLNLVNPSMFPLVYGRTRVLTSGGQVGLDNLFDSCGQGEVAPIHARREVQSGLQSDVPFIVAEEAIPYCWSTKFQWLPCEVQSVEESNPSVRITSHINDLHPAQHKSLYGTIEKLISKSIELWNAVLMKGIESWNPLQRKGAQGRVPMRIGAFGIDNEPSRPTWARNINSLQRSATTEEYDKVLCQAKEFFALAEPGPQAPIEFPKDWDTMSLMRHCHVMEKWERLFHVVHHEPGTAFSYEDWKAGKTSGTVIGPGYNDNELEIYGPNRAPHSPRRQELPHSYYSVSLQDDLPQQNLQVVVKIVNIKLSPVNPSYPGGSWQIDGLVFDVESHNRNGEHQCEYEPAVQEVGLVSANEGRFIAWPNTLQHRLSPSELHDRSKSGHRRYLVLSLVDLHYRICSTRNVPPQRYDWLARAAILDAGDVGLLQEFKDQALKETKDWPMGLEESRRLRLTLAAERVLAVKALAKVIGVNEFSGFSE
ncbi:hypothetical protein BKA61DRAFT_707942 [Leptodontidium sp. MPI-SDFR-AT-0119]|nr:hypothetical protein BKA61DRAFT_707942 [Leptodontidium sp. MPI-SDFR-AT-0119]